MAAMHPFTLVTGSRSFERCRVPPRSVDVHAPRAGHALKLVAPRGVLHKCSHLCPLR